MKWEDHDRWAKKMDIRQHVSSEVNNLIDKVTDSGLLAEFRENKEQLVDEILTGKDLAIAKGSMKHVVLEQIDDHDDSRTLRSDSKIYSDTYLHFFEQKGEDYVLAYHLHHYLDYFDEQKTSDKTIDELLSEFSKKYPHLSHSMVEEMFQSNRKQLSSEMGIRSG